MNQENNAQLPPPTPEKALELVSNLARQSKLSFDEHLYIIECLKVLNDAILKSKQVP